MNCSIQSEDPSLLGSLLRRMLLESDSIHVRVQRITFLLEVLLLLKHLARFTHNNTQKDSAFR
jgi:hypothetical protein